MEPSGNPRDRKAFTRITTSEEILVSVPQAVGLSEKEWVELFRLSPSARSYEALLKAGVPEATLHLPSFDARGTIIERYVYESMTKYFVIPQDIPSRNNARLAAWFRSQKPDDFTFDPEIRKFRMK